MLWAFSLQLLYLFLSFLNIILLWYLGEVQSQMRTSGFIFSKLTLPFTYPILFILLCSPVVIYTILSIPHFREILHWIKIIIIIIINGTKYFFFKNRLVFLSVCQYFYKLSSLMNGAVTSWRLVFNFADTRCVWESEKQESRRYLLGGGEGRRHSAGGCPRRAADRVQQLVLGQPHRTDRGARGEKRTRWRHAA